MGRDGPRRIAHREGRRCRQRIDLSSRLRPLRPLRPLDSLHHLMDRSRSSGAAAAGTVDPAAKAKRGCDRWVTSAARPFLRPLCDLRDRSFRCRAAAEDAPGLPERKQASCAELRREARSGQPGTARELALRPAAATNSSGLRRSELLGHLRLAEAQVRPAATRRQQFVLTCLRVVTSC